VAGEMAGDVQDAVAQPLGLADGVLVLEAELLGPDGDVVWSGLGFAETGFSGVVGLAVCDTADCHYVIMWVWSSVCGCQRGQLRGSSCHYL